MPTSAHFIYVPSVLILGIVLGFIFGGRAARDAFAEQQRRAKAKADRQANRSPV